MDNQGSLNTTAGTVTAAPAESSMGKLCGLPYGIIADDKTQDKRQALRAAYILILSWPRPKESRYESEVS